MTAIASGKRDAPAQMNDAQPYNAKVAGEKDMKDRNRTGRVRRIIGTGQLAADVLLIADVVLVMFHRINAAGLAVCRSHYDRRFAEGTGNL